MIIELNGKRPKIHETAFMASNATLIWDVTVEEDSSIRYGAQVRGDDLEHGMKISD